MKNRSTFSPNLTFSHLAKKQLSLNYTPSPPFCLSTCQFHPKKYASFIDAKTNAQYCDSCSRKLANRGRQMRKVSCSDQSDLVEVAYRRCQESIKQHIKTYNTKLSEIIERLTDMQIRDLMYFNQLLQNNDRAYEQGMISELAQIPKDQLLRIYEIQKSITNSISIKSFETRATLDSKNKRTLSQNSSTTLLNLKSFKQSENSKQNSFINSHQNLINQKVEDSLQDTPESVKSKLSCVKLKPEKSTSVGMFDKIAICQSVEELVVEGPDKENKMKETNRKRRGNADYRYSLGVDD